LSLTLQSDHVFQYIFGANTYNDNTDGNKWTELDIENLDIQETMYSSSIIVSELEANYIVKIYNSSNGLVTNATADSEGIANMTLPSAYRESAFEGTFRVYASNGTFVYSKWFEDVHGGDNYEAKQESRLGFILGGFAAVMAIVAVTLIFARSKQQK